MIIAVQHHLHQVATTIEELDDMYLGNYASPQTNNYVEYVVQSDDTLFGLELKFNISQAKLLAINQISEAMIFPGARIKLPVELKSLIERGESFNSEEGFEAVRNTLRNNSRGSSFIGVNLMDEIQSLSQSPKRT